MDVLRVETALGVVPLWGRYADFDPSRPLVFCASGAFADLDALWWLDEPGADYVFAALPGFNSPELVTTSIGAFAWAFQDAMRRQFGRPYIALGVSTGAVTALAMREASGVVAVEPFLSTAGLWSFQEFLRRAAMTEAQRAWSEAIFADRDYRAVLAGLQVPCEVVVGDVPLEPVRPIRGHPSLVSEADRAAFAAHPLVNVTVAKGGHDVERAAVRAVLDQALMKTASVRPSPPLAEPADA